MTTDDLERRIERLRMIASDDEAAHGEEDSIWEDVLRAIAGGSGNAIELAALALTTQGIEFCRWYA